MIQNYAAHKMLDLTLRGTAYTPPTTVYLALCTGVVAPEDTSLSEVTGGTGYARQAITFAAAADRETRNSAAINFPAVTSAWGTITWAAIMDASSSGNILWATPLCKPLVIAAGDTPPNVPANALRVSLCLPGITNYLGNKWLDHLLRNTAYSAPSNVYLALSTGTISHEDASVTGEVSGGAYARVQLTFAAAADRVAHTSAAATFPAPSGANWGTVISRAIADASSSGNPLFYEDVCPTIINDGDTAPNFLTKGVRVAMKPCC